MANCFRNSLSEDNVDRYNYNWAVWLFLFLALISLLFPLLSPDLNNYKHTTKTSTENDAPRIEANCWCPAQFEKSQVDYTNGYCSSLATGLLQGVEYNNEGLYGLGEFPDAPVPVSEAKIEERKNKDIKKKQTEQRRKTDSRLYMLTNFLTPVVLFSMALLLKLPQLLRALLSSGCVNIDQALESCIACQSIDPTSQQKLSEATVLAISSTLQSSRSKATCMYLSMKMLVIAVVFTEALFVSQSILVDIESMKTDYNNLTENSTVSNETNDNVTAYVPTKGLFYNPDNVFLCRFYIRQLTNVHDFVVQCQFNAVEEEASQISNVTPEKTSTIFQNVLLLYQALFTIVLACLILLIIINIINTISWFMRFSSRSFSASLGLPRSVPNDLALLVHMAWINASPILAKNLADNATPSNDRKDLGDEMDELKE